MQCSVNTSTETSKSTTYNMSMNTQAGNQADAVSTVQDVVVPDTASYPHLTPAFLSSLFELSHAEPQCVVLALVDSDGTVVLNRFHSGLRAPAEGFTGTDTHGTGKKRKKAAEKKQQV